MTLASDLRSDGSRSSALGRVGLELVRRTVRSRRGGVLVAVTLPLGVIAGVAVTVGMPASQRTIAATSTVVQLLMSVVVPFFGVLLTAELRSAGPVGRLAPRLLAAVALAVAFAVYGVVVSAVALAVAGSDAGQGGWQHVGAVVLGSVLVQVIAQLTGTGLGLLLRPAGLAMAATIVLPLGLWLLLGAVEPLHPAQAWLAPFPSAGNLLSGQMRPFNWAQTLVVVLIWNVGLNAQGAILLSRSAGGGTPPRG